ncbi:hypothetical protein O7606_03655 [Micromonospora sp. WMMD882]|uniref:Agd3-related carbohydrate deacetylase n=1 Tax=Micromonospora sp. WMMD882 TaxID=3015151 RepID=UPI00248D3151|nr:hypothetical protein [Micromonospora sp. WMMD882]WBB80492.1 hypothetical protein O7606_03655 [Micromonospora sp. WMMD882]
MVPTGPARRRATRLALAGLTALTVVLGAQTPGLARPAAPAVTPPAVPGLGQVAKPKQARPAPLPKRSGTVQVTADRKQTTQQGDVGAQALNDKVALRALIVATNTADFGVATLTTTLDRVGAHYDIVYTATQSITASSLVRPDGVGKYNAILLTNSMQMYEHNGNYLSGLTSTEWNTLWAYERNFQVRQAALYTSYGTWPEDYCLTSNGEGGVGDTPLPVSLTTAGAGVFDYLNSAAQIPVVQSYVYRTSIRSGCAATPLMTNGSDVLAVTTTSTDGRERIALTFTSNQYLLHSDLLVYGLVRWASKGLWFGEQKHHLNVDIDDWFNTSDHYKEDGTVEYAPGFQVSGHDTVNLDAKQTALRAAYPLASNFTFTIAFNGSDIDPFAGDQCSPNGDATTLTATTKCLKNNFRWINHTFNHPELNSTNYATSYAEIDDNRTAGDSIGLSFPDSVLKTPEYSGLGVYNDDPDNDTGPPTDHGLEGSNTALLDAAEDLGVTTMAGNMSFGSHKPADFNAARVHPLNSAIAVVPCWPTNIAYHTTTPAEQTVFYNSFYGPNGLFPYWPTDRTYAQLLDYEAGVGLQHVASGSIYAHTFHIANVRDYGSGDTLITDWVEAVLEKYTSLYSVPLLNSQWTDVAAYTLARNAHFAALDAGVDAVYDRTLGTIAVTSPAAGSVRLGGVTTTTTGATSYGTDVTVPVTLAANTTVTLNAAPRP